nr:unnamed protein product [Callosobruchus chinensis]
MLNIAAVNSYVIYNHNLVAIKKKSASRIKYMVILHEQLVMPWQETRRSISALSRNLKECISNIIGVNPLTTIKWNKRENVHTAAFAPLLRKG